MATLEKSKITRQAVIDASKKLFYQNGYIDTHYNDIVRESNVNSGSVYYHFKKKGAIAEIIFYDIAIDIKSHISKLFKEYDLQTRTAIESIVVWKLFYTDEKYQRFIYEISKKSVFTQMSKKIGLEYFGVFNNLYKLGYSENYVKMVAQTTFIASLEMCINIFENYITFTEDEAAEFDIRLNFELLKTDYQIIDEIISTSKSAFSAYTVHFDSYFKPVIQKK